MTGHYWLRCGDCDRLYIAESIVILHKLIWLYANHVRENHANPTFPKVGFCSEKP